MAGTGEQHRRHRTLKPEALAALSLEHASWSRRLLCMTYEALIVLAILLVGGLTAVWLPSGENGVEGGYRLALQGWMATLLAAYFAGCWWRFGQTLAMKTWRLMVTAADGSPLRPGRALLRLLLAAATLPLSILWPVLDRDRQFLHDRLADTRVWRIVG